jgi:hypothetical protein
LSAKACGVVSGGVVDDKHFKVVRRGGGGKGAKALPRQLPSIEYRDDNGNHILFSYSGRCRKMHSPESIFASRIAFPARHDTGFHLILQDI